MTTTNTLRRIQGDWMRDGYLDGREPLMVEIDSDGGLHDPQLADHLGGALRCEQWGNDCLIITNGSWTFAPDADELERLGIVPIQMIQ